MCGFIGQISAQHKSDRLALAITWLRRRGPDSQRLWHSSDGQVGLLHARLNIVDPDERANQPFSDQTRGLTVAFNGEIYNYRELRQELQDYEFHTDSDTEVILACYAKDGVAGLRRLKGMYALSLVDEQTRTIILARDPIGKKPLYLAQWGEDVLFGSSLLALKEVWGKDVTINPDAAKSYWLNDYIHPTISAFKQARPLQPGEVLVFNWDGSLKHSSQCIPEATVLYQGEPLVQVIENVRELLHQSVARRVSDLHPPTVLLSGGIDSTVVTAATKSVTDSKNSGAMLQSLTLGAMIPLTNDEFYARYAARRLNLPIRRITPQIGNLTESVTASLDLQDEPLGMISFFLLERLVNAAANYGRILITGDGGDEVFLGYGKPRDWQEKHTTNGQGNWPEVACGPAVPDWFGSWGRDMATSSLVGHGFAKVDRASAEQGVEVRCPLLDWDLVSYVRSLPYHALFSVNRSKSLLKDMLGGWPAWFIEREKIGFVYNIRWFWGTSGYKGLREAVEREAVTTFEQQLPQALRVAPSQWKNKDIFRYFQDVWKLLVWSRFLARVRQSAEQPKELMAQPGSQVRNSVMV